MARVIISDGGSPRTVELTDVISVAGRSSENKLHIEDKQASRRHCQIERIDFGFKLVDLESRNGTRVNDRVVNQALLRPGDRIQIGKHVLVFEDPAFKEPPAEVAARFAPPAAEAPRLLPVPPPAASAPAPAAAPAAPEPAPAIRRRSGHTTAVMVRSARFEREKERKMLTFVGVGATVFVLILFVLIIIPGGSGTPATKKAQEDYERGEALFRNRQFDQARHLLLQVPSGEQGYYPKAQSLLRQIEDHEKRAAAAVSESEKRDFDAIYEFCEKNRANPGSFDRMRGMCEEFKQKYPKSGSLAKIEEYLKIAREGQSANRSREVNDALGAAQEDLKKHDYAGALRRLAAVKTKFDADPVEKPRIVKLYDEVLEKATPYYQAKDFEAKELKSRARRDEAAKIYEALVISMGDGQVDDLATLARAAKLALEALK
jgi:pSer/pThr/pTyr-binding forkhead associated (FHA) protein